MIYILGGNGFVGSAFVRYCKKNKIDYVNIEINNYNEYKNTKCDVFINVDGNSKKYLADREPLTDFDMNPRTVLKTIQEFSFKKYVLISTVDVYNDPSNTKKTYEHSIIKPDKLSNYGLSKYISELIVRKYCDNWLILRLGGMVGENMVKNPVFDILNDKPLFIHPESELQYINTDKVAEITLNLILMDIKNDVFNICGTGTIKIREIIDMVGKKYPDNDFKKIHYDVNNEKIRKYFKIPNTKETIKQFLEGKNVK